MAAIENEHSYAIQLRESANDGSDFSNADADYRVVFLGEDGELHKKDSAGAVTDFAGSGIAATIGDAKGDLIGFSAADTPARLAVGTNGQVLTAASGEATGLQWATPSGGLSRSTLGTTSLGGSFDTTLKTVYKKVTLAADGFIMSIAVGVKGDGAGGSAMQAAVMTDNAGVPLIIVATGQTGANRTSGGVHISAMSLSATARFVTVPIGAYLVAGDYHLAVVTAAASGTDIQLAYASGTGSDRTKATTDGVYDEANGASSAGTNDYSIFANILS